jgi:hypothetical protein
LAEIIYEYTGHTEKNGEVLKVDTNVFLSLHGHNIQQRELSKFLMLSSSSLVLIAGPRGPVYKMASQQEKAFCVLCFEVSRSVITVQREFRVRFKKYILVWCVIVNCARNSRCTVITDLDTS